MKGYKIGMLLAAAVMVASFALPESGSVPGPLVLGVGLIVFIVCLIGNIVSKRRKPSQTVTPAPNRDKPEPDQSPLADAVRRVKEREAAEWAKIEAIPEYEITLSDEPYQRQKECVLPQFANITPKGDYSDVVVFDLETTGLGPASDRIVEIGAVRYSDGKPVSRYHTYVNPGRPIPEKATAKNGITDAMVAGAPGIGAVLPSFDAFVGDAVLVSYNLKFDLSFILHSGSRVMETKRRYICALEQARKLIKKSEIDDYTLDTVCNWIGITNAKEHSAIADAFAAGAVFFHLVREVTDK